jgi:16S rRNA (guanine527-N7)-methyltransferase
MSEVSELIHKNEGEFSNYLDRLLWWNEKINLVSRDVPRETLANHIQHSLSISTVNLFKAADSIIDSGTGGGLPGIPLAISFPEKQVVLNDIVAKKIMACKHMASGLGLKNIDSSPVSIDKIAVPEGAVIISKHAFKINDLVSMITDEPWSGIILLKGGEEVDKELSGIEEPLEVEVIDLEEGFKNPFYEGKSIVKIERRKNE